MTIRVLILVVGITLLTCSCNKAEIEKPATEQPVSAQQPSDTNNTLDDTKSDEQLSTPPIEQAGDTAQAPVAETADSAQNTPQESTGKSGEGKSDSGNSKTPASKPENEVKKGHEISITPVENMDKYKDMPVSVNAKLQIPKDNTGVWNSIAELKDNTVINHDSNYFDSIDFRDETSGSYATYRDGEFVTRKQFTYTFDRKRGRLIIRFEDGSLWTVLLQQPVDNPAEIRLTRITENLTTIFRIQ